MQDKIDIENKKNKLNLEIRKILQILDLVEGLSNNYYNYENNSLSEQEFLDKQLLLTTEARIRLQDIFK